MYGAQKSQRLTLNVETSKISSADLKKEMYCSKRSNVMICAKVNWKASKIYFYNWDRPLDLVLVVYDLIELIIEASLWSKDYSTFDTHPQHTSLSSINAYFICVIVHSQMWCVCSITCWLNPKKIFEYFICFWKWFYTFIVFVQNAFLCVILQKLVQRHFRKKLAIKSFL